GDRDRCRVSTRRRHVYRDRTRGNVGRTDLGDRERRVGRSRITLLNIQVGRCDREEVRVVVDDRTQAEPTGVGNRCIAIGYRSKHDVKLFVPLGAIVRTDVYDDRGKLEALTGTAAS